MLSLYNYSATKICSSPYALAYNFIVTVSNDSPAKGENVVTTFDFDLSEIIPSGTAYYSATINGLGPYTSQADLCDETAKSGDQCPLDIGHHHQESSSKNTVSGKVVTEISWYDLNGAQILCAEITTKNA